MDLHKKALKNNLKKKEDQEDEDQDCNVQEELKDSMEPEVLQIPKTGKPIRPTVHMTDNTSSGASKQKLIHDYSPISPQEIFEEILYMENGTPVYFSGKEPLIFLSLHGAGDDGATFALVAQEMKTFASLVSFDFRGHGNSQVEKDQEDLSLETLIKDSLEVLDFVLLKRPKSNIVIMGHSMGGAIAVKLCQRITNMKEQNIYHERVHGLIVIDVVEGTAIEALPFMQQIVKNRPTEFPDVESCIQWHVQSSSLRYLNSARISVPNKIVEVKTETGPAWKWRVDLLASQKYWLEWFKGLTGSFLNIRIPKLLMVAEKERMDKELTIAQMQGQFKLVVLHNTGHYIHEDDPMGTVRNLHHFLHSFRIPLSTDENEELKSVGIGQFTPQLVPFDERGVF